MLPFYIRHISKPNWKGFKHVFSSLCTSGYKRGVVIPIPNKDIRYKPDFKLKDKEARIIFIKGKIDGTLGTFVKIYAPLGSN